MTPQQTTEVLAYLTEAYPSMKSGDPRAKVAVWCDVLGGSSAEAVTGAARSWARTEKFPPSPVDLLRGVADETDGDIPSWMECKALIEASSHGRGLPEGAHPVVRATSAICGGPYTLAALSPSEAERAVKSAYATGLARYQRSLNEGHRYQIEESSDTGQRRQIEAATSGMFAKP